jgi:hypothetical protein
MTDDIKDDTHDQLVKAFIEYSRWNERFERYGYHGSSVQAREFLRDIRDLCKKRRMEIQASRNLNKKAKTEGSDLE